MRPTRSASKKRNVLEERQEAGMLWVAPVGDCLSSLRDPGAKFLGGKLNKQKTN